MRSFALTPAARRTVFTAALAAAFAFFGTACGPTSRPTPAEVHEALRGLPPHRDPPYALDDEEDFERARKAQIALPVGDPARSERRRELWAAAEPRIRRHLAAGAFDQAHELYGKCLEMWEPSELRAVPPADLEALAPIAEEILDRAARSGRVEAAAIALAVLSATRPDRAAAYEAEWRDIAAYLDELDASERGGAQARHVRPIQALEDVLLHFPSPWVGAALVDLYLALQKEGQTAAGGAQGFVAAAEPVKNLIRVFAALDRLEDAPAVLDGLAGQLGDAPRLREIVREMVGPQGKPQAYVDLAVFLSQDNSPGDAPKRLVPARRLCAAAARRFPEDGRAAYCAAIFSAQLEELPLAILWMERAVRAAPKEREYAEALARFYLARLSEDVLAERVDRAQAELRELERFFAEARARFSDPLTPGLETAYVVMGRGLFALGDIAEAQRYLTRARAIGPAPDAAELLGTIALKRGRYAEAAQALEEAARLPRETPQEQRLDRARLFRLAGEARRKAGEAHRARELWSAALRDLDELLAANLPDFRRAQAWTERGRVLYSLGRAEEARQSFEHAIDEIDEANVYADAIAFLLTHGETRAALDAYHRALGRPKVTEYYKVYASLWVVQFARARGDDPDRFALDYLAERTGSRWYHELARYVAGKQSYEELLAKADTRGKRAEAYFYEALARYGRGDRRGAEKLLRWVLATDMLGFFEYDMASHLLSTWF